MTAALTPAELDGVRATLLGAGEDVGALDATLIAGGRSNLTFRLTDGIQAWVLRTPPRAGRTPSAHDVAREFRVTSGLAKAGFPVPRPIALCEDSALLGGPFTLTGFVTGRSVQSQHDLAAMDDHRVGQAVHALVSSLVDLHQVNYVGVGLERFGRPDGYAERQLERWTGQWALVSPDDPALDASVADLAGRLRARLPQQSMATIVHGDFRIDNALMDLTGAQVRVAAVVDWELSTVGDPIADVALMCAYRHQAFDLVLGTKAAWTSPRLPSADDLAGRYAELAQADLRHWDFHLAAAYFKVAVIAGGIAHRQRVVVEGEPDGGTASAAIAQFIAAGLELLRG